MKSTTQWGDKDIPVIDMKKLLGILEDKHEELEKSDSSN